MKPEYTAKEMSEILGVSKQAVLKRAKNERWPGVAVRNGRGGGCVKVFSTKSLPVDVRDKIAAREMDEAIARFRAEALLPHETPWEGIGTVECGRQGGPVRETVPENGVAIVPFSAGGLRQVVAPQKADRIGMAKWQVVTAWREMVRSKAWSERRQATEAFLLAYATGELLPGAFQMIGDLSVKTLYRLDKRLREAGGDFRALSDGRGGWKRNRTTKWKKRNLSAEAQAALLRCYLSPAKPQVALAIRAARVLLEKAGIREESSDSTFRRWLKDYARRNQHVIVLAREGEKAYRDRVGPYITRDLSCLEVGQVLVADGHTLNFTSRHPDTGRPTRLKLILFFDWASRMPVGWQIMPEENMVAIHAALRMAILTLGKIPQAVYLDNGRAFKAKLFTETAPDFDVLTGLYGRLGIGVQFATPYNARAKVVERFFLTMSEQFERLVPSFCGSRIGDKPAWMARNEKFHRAWHEARSSGWLPDIRETGHLVQTYVGWYARQPHDGLGGRTPLEVFEAGRGPGVDPAEIEDAFLWEQVRMPRNCRVTLYGIDYESDCLHGLGEKVRVRFSTSDLSRVHCFTLDGERLGEAYPVQALEPLARLFGEQVGVDQVQAALKRQRRLAKETKACLEALGMEGAAGCGAEGEGLKALPWARKVAVIDGGKQSEGVNPAPSGGTDDAPEEERRRLELVYARVEQEQQAEAEADGPVLERPEYFDGELSRYDWCFRAKHQYGQELSTEDAAFMTYFEATESYETNRQRYADLRELFELFGKDMIGID